MSDEDEKDEFEFRFQIKNFSLSYEKTGEAIESPPFDVECLDRTKWTLSVYPRGKENGEYVDIFLTRCSEDGGDDNISIIFTIELEAADSSRIERRVSDKSRFQRNTSLGFSPYIKRKILLRDMKSMYLPDDVLTVYCKLEDIPRDIVVMKESTCRIIPEILETEVPWSIKKWTRIKGASKDVQFDGDYGGTFRMFISKSDGPQKIIILTLTMLEAINKNIWVSCCVSVLDKEGSEVFVRTTHHHFSDTRDTTSQKLCDVGEIKYSYLKGKIMSLQGKILSLRCVLKMETGRTAFLPPEERQFEAPKDEDEELDKYIEQELVNDYEKMFLSGDLSDVKVRSGSKVINCHKIILYARSPIMSYLLDKAEESAQVVGGCVIDINDVDCVTLEQMIYFMYTDKIKNLNFASALKLLGAGHRYQVKLLKQKCALYLSEFQFNFENIYDVLVAAHLYSEGDLKRRAIAYICEYFSRICLTIEWENFRKTWKELHAYTCREIRRIKRI